MSACNNCGRLDCRECNPYKFDNVKADTIRADLISFRPVFPLKVGEPLCETTAASVPSREMVERVACAIWIEMDPDERTPADWRDLPGVDISEVGTKAVMLKAARAAVAAMREPTANMCQAALETSVRENKGIEYSPYQGWQAMIDEALK
jgi:ribosomal protein L12E/L44/L45/RPP1/RPP2